MTPAPSTAPDDAAPRPARRSRTLVWSLRAGWAVLAVLAAGGLYYAWWLEVEFRFKVVDPGKVYQSGAMPPDVLRRYVDSHGIRTVLDLRDAKLDDMRAEREALADSPADYVSVPMPPAPEQELVERAMQVMLDPARQPILVHCHHGEGRSVMIAALYRIVGMGVPFDEALRLTARLPSGLYPLIDVLPTGFEDDNFKTRIMREYVDRQAEARGDGAAGANGN